MKYNSVFQIVVDLILKTILVLLLLAALLGMFKLVVTIITSLAV